MDKNTNDKITRLYEQLPQSEPSEFVDARIKKQAGSALKHPLINRINNKIWLSTAAAIVLSVGLVTTLYKQEDVENIIQSEGLMTTDITQSEEIIERLEVEEESKSQALKQRLEESRQKKAIQPQQLAESAVMGDAMVSDAQSNKAPRFDFYQVNPALPSIAIMPSPPFVQPNTENYAEVKQNGIQAVQDNPVSTFSIDVDTGSYTNARRMITEGQMPPKNAIRVEEFINYFSYESKAVADDKPFHVLTEVLPTPWNRQTRLLRLTLDTAKTASQAIKPSNLVFLIDVSGSMNAPDKLGLLKKSLKLLSRQMRKEDKVSIVVYAGASGVVLEPTAGNDVLAIESALDKLNAGGSTNGGAGIELAYKMAESVFIKGGNNRVILATDGDFNVGTVNHDALIDLVEQQRTKGIELTTLGFGAGNYNDHLMEQLANKGNGNHAYIDSLFEARKVLVEELSSTLETVAADVKIQIEFNPYHVKEYRLIGYENRHLQREDFNNDKVDAGEIGSGHSVTALYEISMANQPGSVDDLRYARSPKATVSDKSDEIAFVKLRYKLPGEQNSQLSSFTVNQDAVVPALSQASNDSRFAAAVAAFAQKLQGGKYLQDYSWQSIKELAINAKGKDEKGLRSGFIQLVEMAESIENIQ